MWFGRVKFGYYNSSILCFILQVLIQMDCFLLSGQVEKQKLLQDWKDIWRERHVAEIHHT